MKIKGGRSQFYQWELDQLLIVEEDCTEVHFFNGTQTQALCCAVKEVDGELVADVPNELLQTAADLHAYAWDDESKCVVGHRVFRVEPKAKPAEYAYTQTEVLRYRELAETGRVYIAAYDPEDPWGDFEELEEAFLAGNLLICIKDDYVYQLVEYVPLDRFTFQREDADGIHRVICYTDAWKPEYIPQETVRYTEQALTEEQQAQARKNISAVDDGFPDEIYDYVGDNCVHFTQQPTELTEEQKAQAWKNIGGSRTSDSPAFKEIGIYQQDEQSGEDYGAFIEPGPYVELDSGERAAELTFYGATGDERTLLRNIANPVSYYDAANKEYVDGIAGDIETALDSIIAIQNSLIGGDGA